MSDRWYIYKNGVAEGPLTPEAIRQGLRDGSIDPFDLVGREGSQLRREIVEVDELFFTSKIVYGDEGGGDPLANLAQTADSGVRSAPADESTISPQQGFVPQIGMGVDNPRRTQPSAYGQGDVPLLGQGHMVLAEDQRPTVAIAADGSPAKGRGQRPAARRSPKHYYLKDARTRMVGPLSVAEIQSLFYRGVLDKKVMVLRDGSTAQVPIQKFVAIFSSSRSAKAPQQGSHPAVRQGGGPMRANYGKPPKARPREVVVESGGSPIAVWSLVAGALLTLAAAFMVLQQKGANLLHLGHAHSTVNGASRVGVRSKPAARAAVSALVPAERHPTPKVSPPPAERPIKAVAARMRGGALPTPRPAQPLPPVPNLVLHVPQSLQAPAAAIHVPIPVAKLSPVHGMTRKQARAEAKRQQLAARAAVVASRPRVSTAKSSPRSAVNAMPGRDSTAAGASVSPVPPAATPASVPAAAGGAGGAVARLSDGEHVQHLGPFAYAAAELAQCDGACNITFRGPQGSVKAAFFKQAWAEKLTGKTSGLYLSGTAHKGAAGVKVIVSDIE